MVMMLRMVDSDPPLMVCSGGFTQRFYTVKPCPKEMKCDVEVSYFAAFFFPVLSEPNLLPHL